MYPVISASPRLPLREASHSTRKRRARSTKRRSPAAEESLAKPARTLIITGSMFSGKGSAYQNYTAGTCTLGQNTSFGDVDQWNINSGGVLTIDGSSVTTSSTARPT